MGRRNLSRLLRRVSNNAEASSSRSRWPKAKNIRRDYLGYMVRDLELESSSSPPVARFSARVCEGKHPDGAGQIGVVDDKGKPLHDESSRAILQWWGAFRVGLNRPNSFSRRLLEFQSQAGLSALIKGD